MVTIHNLSVQVDSKEVVSELSLKIKVGELHALMGPNGSGKSSLSLALAGHPAYHIGKSSQVLLDGHDLLSLLPEDRAKRGLFLSFQHPVAIPGLTVQQLIKSMVEHLRPDDQLPISRLRQQMIQSCELLKMNPDFLKRSVGEGFSGGEKKRLEMLQLLLAQPKLAILDEIDSGLDVDAIKIVAKAVKYAQETFHTSFLIVTHYRRILDHLKPDKVHIMVNTKLVKSGNPSLIEAIEKNGYTQYDSIRTT